MKKIISGSRAGFSMLEVILALVILGILVLLGSMGFLDIVRGYIFTKNNMESVVDTDIFKGIHIQLSRIYEIESVSADGKTLSYYILEKKGSEIKKTKKTFTLPPLEGKEITMRFLDQNEVEINLPIPADKVKDIYFIELARDTIVGEKMDRTHVLRIAPYHLQYRNSKPVAN